MTDNNPFLVPGETPSDKASVEARRVPAGNATQWIGAGWALFTKAPGVWIGISAVMVVIIVTLDAIPGFNLLVNLLIPVLAGGVMLGCKALEDGEEICVNHLFDGFRVQMSNLVLIGVFYLVGVVIIKAFLKALGVASILSVAGVVMGSAGSTVALESSLVSLLVVAFLYVPLSMAVWYAPALVLFQQVSAFDAMKASFFGCLKNWVPMTVYGIIVFVLVIAATVPLLLGWLVLLPLLLASTYTSYRDLFS